LGEIVKSVEIKAPVQKVYSYVVDPWNAPRFISSITKVISGPEETPTKGNVWRAEANFLGQKREVNLRLHNAVENKAVRFVLEGDPQAVIVLQLTPGGTGHNTSVTLTLEVPGVPTLFVNALLGGLLGEDMARLKENLEA
jgi:uncharacterized membrane protein